MIFYRIAVMTVLGFILVLLMTGFGAQMGRSIGLDDKHNMGEVILSFLAGGFFVWLYMNRRSQHEEGQP